MRVALKLDDRLVEEAKSRTGIEDISVLMDAAMKALIERDTAKRLESIERSKSTPANARQR